MKTSELEKLLETATTTASIAIVPVGLEKGASKKYGLEATREKLKKASRRKKANKITDPNTFSTVVMEYDYAKTAQEAIEIAAQYKADGYSLDEIITKLAKVFDISVVKQAIKEIK